ncbi:bifunctional 5,10-methylenetetrahydrofolate dehydrogenase/5,10-methenyltetrahydrofolate cyclohydrolase [Candidatus Parcubacteria bacterium]|nr:MAG: bifunctional 5,10-methylenetetrahydrofolate dehydrogenase/5,10-methenyltetrahydrofolate cyclohydrolase [Candidatus Parcubacteria bacterium]
MATLLDGKALAGQIIEELRAEYAKLPRPLSLAIVVVGGTEAIRKFVAQKEKVAHELGVNFRMHEYDAAISTDALRKRMAALAHDADPDGIIVQLPLAEHINQQSVLNAVPPEKDVDVLSARALGNLFVGKQRVLPGVVGAVKALLEAYAIDWTKKAAVIVGAGLLVGKPMAAWLLNERVTFSVVRSTTSDIGDYIRRADVVITGVGKPGLITADMVKDGAIVIDAGTSESAGKLVGDVDFEPVSNKASFITPVPGGVGPLTVAMIYKNLLELYRAKKR